MALALAGLPGCANHLRERPIGYAKPVADWAGMNIVFRDGNVYFAGQPTATALRKAPARGIKVVVNLRTPQEMTRDVEFDERTLVEELEMGYVWIPMTAASLSVADADQLKEVLDGARGPVLIHCRSAGRVGALWALYLSRHRGFSLEDAVERGRKAGLQNEVMIDLVKRIAGRQSKPK